VLDPPPNESIPALLDLVRVGELSLRFVFFMSRPPPPTPALLPLPTQVIGWIDPRNRHSEVQQCRIPPPPPFHPDDPSRRRQEIRPFMSATEERVDMDFLLCAVSIFP